MSVFLDFYKLEYHEEGKYLKSSALIPLFDGKPVEKTFTFDHKSILVDRVHQMNVIREANT
jgi:hypothetical protein